MADVVESKPAGPAIRETPDMYVDELAASVSRLAHVFNRTRAHMLDRARRDVEWSAQVLISVLVAHGPMRAGALAEQAQSDPSTISRQIALLVRDGMVERRADPEDGRASLLVATDKAYEAHQHHLEFRNGHFRAMLADWDPGDCARLAELATRFTEDFEGYMNSLAGAGWNRPVSREVRS